MINRLFLLSTVASFAFSGFAYAQETTTAEETDTPSANVTELDIGEPVPQEPSSADAGTYVKSTHGDWSVQCLRVEEGPEPCQMYQLLREEAGNPVAEFSIFKLPDDSAVVAGATIVVPLGTLLTSGLQMYVDSGAAKAYNYSFCSVIGCFARIGFDGFAQRARNRFECGLCYVVCVKPVQFVDVQCDAAMCAERLKEFADQLGIECPNFPKRQIEVANEIGPRGKI